MTDTTTNNDAAAASAAAGSDESSKAATALFDADKAAEGAAKEGASPDAGKGESKDQADPSKAKDEAGADSKDDKSKEKEGEESEEGDDKASDYGDVVLPQDLPEGIEVDQELFGQVKEIAGKHKLPTEAVQELVDAYAKRVTDSDNALKNQWTQVEEGWKKDAKADPEIGGDKFDTSVEVAKRAIAKFGTPALKEALEQTRMGNHPEMIRFFTRIGQKVTEDGSFDVGSGAGQRTRGDVLFDKS